MNPISQIVPVTDAEAAGLAQADAFAALADEITSTAPADARLQRTARPRQRHRVRRSVLVGVPVAACLAVAGLITTSLGTPGQRIGPVAVGPAKAQAAVLSVSRHGGYLDVIVRNPDADPKRYRAEFAKYHLNISLRLVPASPSIVGSVVYASYPARDASQIRPITALGKCFTGGGGNVCPVGVRVALRFRGAATLVFARAARPGERYESAGQATAPGEAMHGLRFVGKTVATVLAMLARRGVTVPQWRVQRTNGCLTVSRHTVPRSWYVYQAVPWAPGQVLLWASSTWPAGTCTPSAGQPVASPSPSPSGA
ncbi:MAG TPA: hypothetical protein VMA73_31370 [Streptosporangiaceae bacterium]|nr:hypothetical protein [Streptosporangiaceae bacterium]